MGYAGNPQPTPVPVPTPVPPKPVVYQEEGGKDNPNPYASQTSANTRNGWTGGDQPVSVDIHGMGDYAVDVKNIADFEDGHKHLELLIDGLTKSWGGGAPLAEAKYAMDSFMHNFGEFSQYLQNLHDALYNIAFAAQSVADCYSGTDGWSAADVNAVDFAFGDNVTKPAGWSYEKTDTWADGHKSGQITVGDTWVKTVTTRDPKTNTTTTVTTDRDGKTQTTKVTVMPDGTTVIVVTGTDGKTTTSTSQTQTVGNTQTTTTKQNGKVTGTKTVVAMDEQVPGAGTMHVVTTTTRDADGKVTGRVVQSTYNGPEGTGTTTATYGADGTLIDEVSTGATTASAGNGRDTTVTDAYKNIDQRTEPQY